MVEDFLSFVVGKLTNSFFPCYECSLILHSKSVAKIGQIAQLINLDFSSLINYASFRIRWRKTSSGGQNQWNSYFSKWRLFSKYQFHHWPILHWKKTDQLTKKVNTTVADVVSCWFLKNFPQIAWHSMRSEIIKQHHFG